MFEARKKNRVYSDLTFYFNELSNFQLCAIRRGARKIKLFKFTPK